MTGNLYRGQAGLPFSSSLRIYEPLEAFPADQQEELRATQARADSRAEVENAELLASLGRITRQGGDPFPTGATDLVRALAVPGSAGGAAASDAGQPKRMLYCPSQLVLRAGLAANALMEGIHGPLARLLIPAEQRERHQERIDEARSHAGLGRLHTRASTWGIPFSWFCLFTESDPADVVEYDGRIVTVRIRATIGEALERVRYAVAHLALAAPDLDMLEDLTQLTEWLELFHPGSVVELDYGAVADKVYPDDSPMDVRLGIECLAEGDMTGAAAAYRRLASRWIPIRQLARAS
ncbi:hypothetical protein QK292_04975 [Arthrobacter sp. AL08]|uniref:hypothetical protein n=1 Tax=Micrococcaceae TaxID=1268 RepID=UPI001CFF764D|nr:MULTISPECIES: hypothetical protein [Micrococcaceae]MCB5280712.1 hypothetical protein [Arthrobacter sp. ES1]MDD1475867.1 hypothetical protein [Arthrobacter sp. H16F315]MDI3241094.1 hypothetical protein [Arthrobacter sp. AL05]MDI3276930.1 hypothetical protein [Arthrobacter sp. AL08]MDJ0352930.1 hypothetical protein [Pseudarthrobacter sp. PH31-O2]